MKVPLSPPSSLNPLKGEDLGSLGMTLGDCMEDDLGSSQQVLSDSQGFSEEDFSGAPIKVIAKRSLLGSLKDQQEEVPDPTIYHDVKNAMYTVPASSMATLMPGKWLNDEVINAFLDVVRQRLSEDIYLCSTYTYSQDHTKEGKTMRIFKKGSEQILDNKKLIIIPINFSNNHWMLATVNLEKRQIS
jgi:Ulp1 family protease